MKIKVPGIRRHANRFPIHKIRRSLDEIQITRWRGELYLRLAKRTLRNLSYLPVRLARRAIRIQGINNLLRFLVPARATSRVPHGSHGLLEKGPNVYAGPYGFTGFYPEGGCSPFISRGTAAVHVYPRLKTRPSRANRNSPLDRLRQRGENETGGGNYFCRS